jgi:Nucleotidyltransferase domain/Aminoglycoside adenylyltransferase, C-terminal domain
VLPALVERSTRRYLADVDRLLPGAVIGFYVVGSVALGAYRERRSDIDFVAVVDGDLDARQLRRLRAQHALSGLRTSALALRQRRSPLSGTCNGVYIRRADVGAPVEEITPLAAHVGHTFTTGPVGSDVSPVAWKVLRERGVAVRGPEPSELGLEPQPERLRPWCLENLESYWRPWANAASRSSHVGFRLRPRWSTAWGALGAPRLHCTIATGEVVSKEAAGEYALGVFDSRFHPLVADALASWRDEPTRLDLSPDERRRRTAEFVLEVIDSARSLPVHAT